MKTRNRKRAKQENVENEDKEVITCKCNKDEEN